MRSDVYKLIYTAEKDNWWYRVRRRIVADIISNFFSDHSGALKMLDVGCGTGMLMKELKKFGVCYGVDNSPLAVNFCKQNFLENVDLGDITNIQFPDNFFDVVICLDVLEHVSDDNKAISELKRVVKKEGIIIIFVPAFNFLWGWADEAGHHFRRYTYNQIFVKLRSLGLHVVRSSYFNTILFLPILFFRFFEKAFFSVKKIEFVGSGGPLSRILFWVFSLEAFVLKRFNFPFGVSLMAICRK
ncbi:MAG: class I SAM-dependent methyltransferase [Patescibacteria group bacterium]|nr:class I SAM-dependent methyltransferase [Patescibacteria group bacterium]